ncbi:MAG: FtsW/RodA/SpoVE family cell cycle protein, partial [Lachnospiraceae bacterium]|nr:FtsW/RodA/SpoVE family cell cycle protein [Lachnospiraceae bacterium]
ELGLFGAICVILMYILLLWRLVLIATKAKDIFGSFVVIGIMAHMALQVILNIAVVTNTIPNTGITLPFISYGGTSIMFLVFEMFVALSVSKGLKLEEV